MFFLPYRIDRRLKGVPYVTIALIAVNVLVFALSLADFRNVITTLGFRPNLHGLYTWFTSMFLHADPIGHLGWNMYFLWLFGSVVEDAIGKGRYIVLYLAGGLIATLTHTVIVQIFLPEMARLPLIGASGGVAAVIGLFAVRMYRNKMRIGYLFFFRWESFTLTSVAGVSIWLGRELLSGFITIAGIPSTVANWAHIGGFAFGALSALALGFAKDADRDHVTDEAREYAALGAGEVAAAKFQQLAEDDPNNPEWHLERARSILSSLGDSQEAAHEVDKAIELLMRSGQHDQALIAYQELGVKLGESHIGSRPLLTIGSLAETRGDLETARKAYYELCWNRPEAREAEKALFRLAHVYLAQGRADEAMTVWDVFKSSYPVSDWYAFADKAFGAAG